MSYEKPKLPFDSRVAFGVEYDPHKSSLEEEKEYIRKSIAMTIDKHPLIEAQSNDEMLDNIVYNLHDSINGGQTVLLDGYITIKDIYDFSGSR